MIVKCINSERSALTNGKRYSVYDVDFSYYYLIDDRGVCGGWIKSRFEVIDSEFSNPLATLTNEQLVDHVFNEMKSNVDLYAFEHYKDKRDRLRDELLKRMK